MSLSKDRSTILKVALGALLAAGGLFGYQLYKKKQYEKQLEADMASYPIIDLAPFLAGNMKDAAKDCKEIARLLHEYGLLIVKDPRVPHADNETFIDMMERYYEQPAELRNPDVHPELYYQVGTTPEGVEKARDHCSKVAKLKPEEKPYTLCPPERDPKSRFFWRMGERPTKTEFENLNAPPVIPKAFPEWEKVMNRWGGLMLTCVDTVARMAAIGFDFPENTFTDLMKFAPHLLAPTASNLGAHGALGTVFASYHYDLNFLTIHGRSRFPGLYVWTRQGKKMLVRVPPNCLLLQAGKQFEWLTGGEVLAGFHEVVVVDATRQAIEKAKAEKRSLWRISSTLFSHIASDQTLEPLGRFKNAQSLQEYPSTKAGNQVKAELEAIKLAV